MGKLLFLGAVAFAAARYITWRSKQQPELEKSRQPHTLPPAGTAPVTIDVADASRRLAEPEQPVAPHSQ